MTGAVGVGLAVLFGEPVLVVLVAPLLLVAALGLLHRPGSAPRLRTRLDHVDAHRGPGHPVAAGGRRTPTTWSTSTRVAARAPYVAMHPANGHVGALLADGRRAARRSR